MLGNVLDGFYGLENAKSNLFAVIPASGKKAIIITSSITHSITSLVEAQQWNKYGVDQCIVNFVAGGRFFYSPFVLEQLTLCRVWHTLDLASLEIDPRNNRLKLRILPPNSLKNEGGVDLAKFFDRKVTVEIPERFEVDRFKQEIGYLPTCFGQLITIEQSSPLHVKRAKIGFLHRILGMSLSSLCLKRDLGILKHAKFVSRHALK